MPDYRRNRVPGGSYFFTVNLLERQRHLLVEHVDALRAAVRMVRNRQPFHIDAWVVLPDHLHCLWTLPPGDADYSKRWKAIKTAFARPCRGRNPYPVCVTPRASVVSGSGGSGNTPFAMIAIMRRTWITSASIQSSMDGWSGLRIGLIPRFIAMCGWGFIRWIGVVVSLRGCLGSEVFDGCLSFGG